VVDYGQNIEMRNEEKWAGNDSYLIPETHCPIKDRVVGKLLRIKALYEGYVRSHTHELKIAWGKATYVRPF
jgi:hypothetical protein